ncbi:hypothetical protein WN943_014410 [Citrus x changshan-huyou]
MQDLSFSKTLNPSPFFPKPHFQLSRQFPQFSRLDIRALAGRSKKKPGGESSGRLEGNAAFRRRSKRKPKYRPVNLADYPFYRFKNSNKKTLYADNFTESELEMIGFGYDRMVRFMEKDDPDLRHPYDWYKYGEYGPYSWRGVVVGEPVRGRFSDERVRMYSPVKDHEEWEKIEQHEMGIDFGERLKKMDKSVGFRYFWVFVRHPRWRVNEKPWEQWTLVAEVVIEAGKKRLDKWNLMGRLGNKARSSITQCAAWMRPDIIYVKRPVYQCRFEPQDNFFKAILPFLDPKTEGSFLFELRNDDDGSVEICTYFGGLCKIARVSPKAFVDDVVNAYEKLSEEKKSKCLEFLLLNHPVQLLHPYTKEWKAKLEEEELGCDAPDDDDDDDDDLGSNGENEFTDWIEDDSDGSDDGEFVDENDDVVMDMDERGGDESGDQDYDDDDEEEFDPEEDKKLWEEEFKKATSNSERMEMLAKRSVETSTVFYKKQLELMKSKEKKNVAEDGDETALRGKRAKVTPEEWKIAGFGPWRKRMKKSKIPPELFLRSAVRPFTYRNLVKEIVLTRHAILDGDIGVKE